MQFEYTGRHMDVTPTIRAHVEEHFGKLDHIFENSSTARAHVIIDVIKNRHNAEIILQTQAAAVAGFGSTEIAASYS